MTRVPQTSCTFIILAKMTPEDMEMTITRTLD